MEKTKAVRKIFDRVKSKYGAESFETLTTDGDNKKIGQAYKAKLVTKRQFDPRHGLKSISRNFPKMASSLEYNDEFPEDIFNGQASRIVSWIVYLIKNIEDSELRGLMWTNSPNYMIGYHINFPLFQITLTVLVCTF